MKELVSRRWAQATKDSDPCGLVEKWGLHCPACWAFSTGRGAQACPTGFAALGGYRWECGETEAVPFCRAECQLHYLTACRRSTEAHLEALSWFLISRCVWRKLPKTRRRITSKVTGPVPDTHTRLGTVAVPARLDLVGAGRTPAPISIMENKYPD